MSYGLQMHESVDVFFLEERPTHCIEVPRDALIASLCASLKLKKNVIVTTSSVAPEYFSHKMWEVHDSFIWIAHRSHGHLLSGLGDISPDFVHLRYFFKLS